MFRVMDERKNKINWGQYNVVLQCTHKCFYDHLELMFEPGMTWDNYGDNPDEWTVEYIIPLGFYQDNLKMFTYQTKHGNALLSIEDMCMYDNVRPVWNKNKHIKHKKSISPLIPSDDEITNVCNQITQHKYNLMTSYCSSSSLTSVDEE